MAGGSLAVTKLAHVSFATQDLNTQAEFYTDRWGMERIDEHGGEMFFRADTPEHHIFQLSSGDAAGLGHVSFEVGSAEDLDRAADLLASRGVEIVTPPTAGLEPGIGKA